jgi:hypothetical protein
VTRLVPQSVWPLSRGAGVVVAVVDTLVDICRRGAPENSMGNPHETSRVLR